MPIPEIVSTLERALEETFFSASTLLPDSLRASFVLVGGAALVRWGRRRKTLDIDVACTPAVLVEFTLRAISDARFCVAPDASIQYTCTTGTAAGLAIPIDLIEIGDECIPWVIQAVDMGGVYVASLPDLLNMKGRAYMCERDKAEKDFADFSWIVQALTAREIDYNPLFLLPSSLSN